MTPDERVMKYRPTEQELTRISEAYARVVCAMHLGRELVTGLSAAGVARIEDVLTTTKLILDEAARPRPPVVNIVVKPDATPEADSAPPVPGVPEDPVYLAKLLAAPNEHLRRMAMTLGIHAPEGVSSLELARAIYQTSTAHEQLGRAPQSFVRGTLSMDWPDDPPLWAVRLPAGWTWDGWWQDLGPNPAQGWTREWRRCVVRETVRHG